MSGLDTLFQKTEERTMSLEGIDNPFDLSFSYNLTFDDDTKNNTTASTSNIGVNSGQLVLTSGSTGTFVSKVKNASSDITSFQVKALGENLQQAVFRLSFDGGNSWDPVTLDALGTATNSGKNLVVEITFQAATVKVSSVAVLYS